MTHEASNGKATLGTVQAEGTHIPRLQHNIDL